MQVVDRLVLGVHRTTHSDVKALAWDLGMPVAELADWLVRVGFALVDSENAEVQRLVRAVPPYGGVHNENGGT